MDVTRRTIAVPVMALVVVLGGVVSVIATEYEVTDYDELKNAIQNLADPGDVILVQPGTYVCTDDRLDIHNSGTLGNPITIRGVLDGQGNRPVITIESGLRLNRAVLYFWNDSHDWVVENLEYYEIRGPKNAANAAGAYIHGDRITHRNILAHYCDNGFFSTSESEDIVIEDSIICYNGSDHLLQRVGRAEDARVHAQFVRELATTYRPRLLHPQQRLGAELQEPLPALGVRAQLGRERRPVFGGNCLGEHQQHRVVGQRIYQAHGSWRTAADSQRQRRWFMLRHADADQQRGNQRPVGRPVHHDRQRTGSAAATDLVLYNNVFYGPSDNVFDLAGSGTVSGSNNYFKRTMPEYEALPAGLTDNVIWMDPGFVDFDNHDFSLTSTSVCIDRGLDNPTYLDEDDLYADGTPYYEPTTDLPITSRSDVGVLDLGAYESSAGGSGPVNQTPYVEAGMDQQTTLPDDTIDLNGDVFDDGTPDPPGYLTTTWTKLSGPGTVSFGDPNAVDTTATFSMAGDYVLKLEAYDGAATGSDTCAVTVCPEGQGGDDYVANSDINISGTVTGTYVDTQVADDVYQSVMETQSGGAPSKRLSYCEKKWTIDVGTGGSSLEFYVQGYKTDVAGEGDDFVFAYSTNDSDYYDMVTITNLVDNDTYLTYELPSSLTGTIYIRVMDTDRTPGYRQRDTVYVDHMFIRVQ